MHDHQSHGGEGVAPGTLMSPTDLPRVPTTELGAGAETSGGSGSEEETTTTLQLVATGGMQEPDQQLGDQVGYS